MRFRIAVLLTAVLAVVPAAVAWAQDTAAVVTVIHGIPGDDDFPADVYVDGQQVLADFTFGTVTDTLEVPAGEHEVQIFPAGVDPNVDPPALEQTVEVPAGINASVVAYLESDGAPTLGVFVNDTSEVAAGQGRVIVRHTAQGPAVDVLVDGEAAVTGLGAGDEQALELEAGSYRLDIVPPGGAAAASLFGADLPVEDGSVTIVYAIGAVDAVLTASVQTISGVGQAPVGVPTGSGGLQAGIPTWLVVVTAAAALGIVGGVARLVRARRLHD